MRHAVLLTGLLAVASATPQYYGSHGSSSSGVVGLFAGSGNSNSNSFIATGCDPNTGNGCGGNTGGGTFVTGGGAANCPQDRVVTVPRVSTSVRQVVRTVTVPEQRTQVVTSTEIVPSFSTSIAVRTELATRNQLITRVETNVNTQPVFSTVRLPDQVNTRVRTVYRTEVDTQYDTQTQYVTRQDVRTSVSVINTERQVETVVRVPQLQVSTQVVQVPGPGRTQVQTEYSTRQVISYYQAPARTILRTSVSFRTEFVTRTIRQPDTTLTVTSVSVVPVSSVIVNTRVVPQFVTATETVGNTITRTQSTTQVVPVRSTIVETVHRTQFETDFVTETQQVVRTEVQQQVQTVRVPSQPRVVFRTEQVQVTSTIRGPDTYSTRIVSEPRQREVFRTRVVERVQNQERVVKQTRGGGYCGGSHSGGGHSYGYHKY